MVNTINFSIFKLVYAWIDNKPCAVVDTASSCEIKTCEKTINMFKGVLSPRTEDTHFIKYWRGCLLWASKAEWIYVFLSFFRSEYRLLHQLNIRTIWPFYWYTKNELLYVRSRPIGEKLSMPCETSIYCLDSYYYTKHWPK